VNLATPADEVWDAIKGFGEIHTWHPLIQQPELRGPAAPDGAGTERIFGVGTPEELLERLVEQDEAGRRSSYLMPTPPFEATDFSGYMAVTERDGGCTVDWVVSYTPDHDAVPAALEALLGDGLFTAGLDALADRFGRA
jgi:hypothetical protein